MQDNHGYSALLHAVSTVDSNNYQICHLLIDKGADINIRDHKGNSALILATEIHYQMYSRNLETARDTLKIYAELIAKGIDINAKNNNGDTALLYTARQDYYELCQMLIDYGADATIQNKEGISALKLVAERSNYRNLRQSRELCKSLIKAMLKPTKKQINSVVALLGLSKRGKIKELNLAGKDVVKMIGRERLDTIRCENREKTRAEIMKIEHRDALRNELLRYLEEQIATQKINC